MKRHYLYLLAGVCIITWLQAGLVHVDMPSFGPKPASSQTTAQQNAPTAAKAIPVQAKYGEPVYLSALGKKLSWTKWNEYAEEAIWDGDYGPRCKKSTGPLHGCVAMEGAICGQSTHQKVSSSDITCSYDTGDSGVLPPRKWVILNVANKDSKDLIGNYQGSVWIKSSDSNEYLSADTNGQLKLVPTSNPGRSEQWRMLTYPRPTLQDEDKYAFQSEVQGLVGCLFAYSDRQGQIQVNSNGNIAPDRNTLDPARVGTFWTLSR